MPYTRSSGKQLLGLLQRCAERRTAIAFVRCARAGCGGASVASATKRQYFSHPTRSTPNHQHSCHVVGELYAHELADSAGARLERGPTATRRRHRPQPLPPTATGPSLTGRNQRRPIQSRYGSGADGQLVGHPNRVRLLLLRAPTQVAQRREPPPAVQLHCCLAVPVLAGGPAGSTSQG